jgi:hypothetical protein
LFNAVIAFKIGLAPVGWLGLAIVVAVSSALLFPSALRVGGLPAQPGCEEAH